MASSANTFGTFLETYQRLGSLRPQEAASTDSEVFLVAKTLARHSGPVPVQLAMRESGLNQETFFRAVLAGKDRRLLEIEEDEVEPKLKLTSLGRSFVA